MIQGLRTKVSRERAGELNRGGGGGIKKQERGWVPTGGVEWGG